MVVSLTLSDEKLDVQLFKNQLHKPNYVAMAFSDDRYMGEDLAFVCSPSWGTEPRVKVFWNAKGVKHSDLLKDNDDLPINPSITEEDSQITCLFSLEKQVTIKTDRETREYNFEEGRYILLATGPAEENAVKYHTEERIASSEKFGKKEGNKII